MGLIKWIGEAFTLQKVMDTLGGRKFLIFVAATVELHDRHLNSSDWVWIAIAYMFFNIVEKLLEQNGTDILGLLKGQSKLPSL